jgi:hypothetical protein
MGEATPEPLPRAGLREFVTICFVVFAFIALAIVVAGRLAFEATWLVWLVALATIPSSRFWSLFGVELRPALRHYTLGAIWLWTIELAFEGIEPFFAIFIILPMFAFLLVNVVIALICLVRMARDPFAWLTFFVVASGLVGAPLVIDAKQVLFGHHFATEMELRARFAAQREDFRTLEIHLADDTTSPEAKSRIQRLARQLGLEWLPNDSERGHHFESWCTGVPPEGSCLAFVFNPFTGYTTDVSIVEGRKRATAANPASDDYEIYLDLGGGWYLHYEHW